MAAVFRDYYVVARKIGLCKQAGVVYAWRQNQDSAAQADGCPAA